MRHININKNFINWLSKVEIEFFKVFSKHSFLAKMRNGFIAKGAVGTEFSFEVLF